MTTTAFKGRRGTYHSPVKPDPRTETHTESRADALPTRQLWIGRDVDHGLYLYPFQPVWVVDHFEPAEPEQRAVCLPEEWFADLDPGWCQLFGRQGPRIDKRTKRDESSGSENVV